MSSNSVCNLTVINNHDFVNHMHDYRLNWTPLSPTCITIKNNMKTWHKLILEGMLF